MLMKVCVLPNQTRELSGNLTEAKCLFDENHSDDMMLWGLTHLLFTVSGGPRK